MNWQQRFGRIGLALLLVALSADSALAQSPAQRGRGGGGPGGPGVPGAPAASGPRGGGSPLPFGGGGVPSGRRGGSSRIEKVSDAVEQLYRQLDEKSLQEVPRREITVERSTEKVSTKLFRADPKLLENKFIAAFQLLPAGVNPSDDKSIAETLQRIMYDNEIRGSLLPPLSELVRWDGRGIFQSVSRRERDDLQKYFKVLAENCPAADRPETAFLTSMDVERDVERTPTKVLRKMGEQVFDVPDLQAWTFTVYAPSEEEAEARARAIVRLLDGGLARPMQRFLLTQGREQLAAARQAQADVATATEAARGESEKLAKPSEISPDILSQLKAQKVMVAVELAGLMARVKACDGMLKDPKRLEISTLQSISDMKVKAEIEFVGIKEKLDQINAFIGEGNDREAAAGRLNEAATAKTRAQYLLSQSNNQAEMYGQLVLLYAPMQIENNQIKIAPIEWTN